MKQPEEYEVLPAYNWDGSANSRYPSGVIFGATGDAGGTETGEIYTMIQGTKPPLPAMQNYVNAGGKQQNQNTTPILKTEIEQPAGLQISPGWLIAGAAVLGLILFSDDKKK